MMTIDYSPYSNCLVGTDKKIPNIENNQPVLIIKFRITSKNFNFKPNTDEFYQCLAIIFVSFTPTSKQFEFGLYINVSVTLDTTATSFIQY